MQMIHSGDNMKTQLLSQINWFFFSVYCDLPEPYLAMRDTNGAVIARRYIYAPPRCKTMQYSIAGLLFLCHYLCLKILITLYSMVWDGRLSRAGPMLFYWPSCSLPFCLLLFSPSLVSCYGLASWGWGLWIDRVWSLCPSLHCQRFLIIVIIIIIIYAHCLIETHSMFMLCQ